MEFVLMNKITGDLIVTDFQACLDMTLTGNWDLMGPLDDNWNYNTNVGLVDFDVCNKAIIDILAILEYGEPAYTGNKEVYRRDIMDRLESMATNIQDSLLMKGMRVYYT